ncbi:DUF748 domain-containing protein [Geopsychrobacter electrodiphilus]|uniref:DUF748 domain-containing protein n=1 Tax=Geopsychrobacter electrodiphilus TaxID=225196 RepID=UPI00037AE208|nr:DUF748 domain-containing protein [Geopsychrobacter electrodiphilus]
MRRWQKILLSVFVLIFVILMAAAVILPNMLRDKAIAQVRQDYHRELKIGKIIVHPLSLQLEIENLDLKEPDSDQTFISFERLQFSLSLRSLIERALIIDDLSLDKPFARIEKTGSESFNFSDFMPASGSNSAESQAPAKPFHFSLNNLQIKDGKLIFLDRSSKIKLEHQIDQLNLALPFIGNIPYLVDRYIQPSISLRVDGSPFTANGQMKPFDRSVETRLDIDLSRIDLVFYAAYFQPFLPFQLTDGNLSLQLKLSYKITPQKQPELKVSGNLALSTLRLKQQGKPLFFLPLLLAELDWGTPLNNEYHFSHISLYDPQLQLTRRADGSVNLLDLFPATPQAQPSAPTKTETKPQIWIANLRLREGKIQFDDEAAPKPAPVAIQHLNLGLSDIQWPVASEILWQLDGGWSKGGHFKAQGKLVHTPLMIDGEVELTQFDLRAINNYIPQDIRLTLASATLDTHLAFHLVQKDALEGKITGTLGVRGFSVTGVSDELLAWESLQFDDLDVDLKPLNISIAEVALNNYLAKIRVQADGQVNLNQIVASDKEGTKVAQTAGEAQSTVFSLPPLRIAEVTLQGGEVSFVDHHLPKLFATSMYKLGGRISGLTTAPGQYASVDLRGELENQSPLTISGKIAPLAGELDTNLKVRFTDIDLAPITPYSGTYLGYTIDKGKLYLDLDYQITKRQVTASNSIFLDQFTFGQAVASKQATGLPVRLAVALLKDRKGEIHLDLPVSGSTDDPKFGIFSTVMTLLKNLLVKAATSPFNLLASMFGGSDDFSQISYAPGVVALTPTDQDNLKKVALMLYERPALKLELSAFVDPEKDPEGYRQEELKRRVENEWRKSTVPGTSQSISATEYLESLQRVYVQAKFPKPRDAFGKLKKLPPAEMEKLILANIRVGDEELNQLAKNRATAVQTTLVQLKPELKSRIFLKNAEITAPPAKGENPARVEFGITTD